MRLRKKDKDILYLIGVLSVISIFFWIYNHITQIVIFWLFVLWIWLWYFLYSWFYDKVEENKWWYLILFIPLIPIIFALIILANFDTYNKYFKESLVSWFTKWTKALICVYRPRFCGKIVKNEIRKDIKREIKYWSWWILDNY